MFRNSAFFVSPLILALSFCAFQSCSGSSTTSVSNSYTADSASKVMGGVGTGVSGAGTLMGSSAFGGNAVAMLPKGIWSSVVPHAFASGEGISVRCDTHGSPMNTAGTVQLNSSDANFAAMTFMCMMAYNSGSADTIQGSYTLLKSLACAIEKAGVTFDGTARATTLTMDTTCFTSAQLSNMGLTNGQTMSVTVNASKPWSVNTYYDAGVSLTVPSFGTFKYGAKVSGTKIEFAAAEDQTAVTANKTGAYAGSWDRGTGELRFESRFDRFAAPCGGSCSNSSQGFGRHFRLYAKMSADSSGNPSGNLSTISAAYTNVNKADDSYSAGSNAQIFTASGDLTASGVKTHYYAQTTGTGASAQATLRTFSSYTNSTAPEGCYTTGSSAAGTCGSGLVPSGNIDFMMANTGSYGTVYVSPVNWLSGLSSGLTFTTVTAADVQ